MRKRLAVIAAVLSLAVIGGYAAWTQVDPGCFPLGTELAYRGTTLAELGLREGDQRSGTVYVTREPTTRRGASNLGDRTDVPLTRQYCARLADGTTAAGSVEDDWTPPPER